MLTGGTALSYRKQDLRNQKTSAVGFSKLSFSHKATQGDAGINLLSLTMPPELAFNGILNPSGSELLNANLLVYKNNITLVSSVRGILQHGVSFLIPSSSQINFLNFAASAGEIFTGTIDYSPTSGVRVVDGQAITASGVLGGEATDFSVGSPFSVGKYPNAQVGAVLVFADGVLKKRNSGNSSTVKDGDYYELDLGNGLGTVVRFNSSNGSPRTILVISNGLLCDRPDGSFVASVEKLQGQINNMASYVANLASTTTTLVLGGAPTYLDLKTFGDRVIALESDDFTIKGSKTFTSPMSVPSIYVGSTSGSQVSQLSNTRDLITDSSSVGINSSNGLSWSAGGSGWTAILANTSTTSSSNGLLVKTVAQDSATSALTIESGGTPRFTVKSDGKVGIGTGSPAEGLDVASTFSLTGYGTVKSSLVQKYPSSTSKAQQFLTKNKTGQFKRSQAVATVSTWITKASSADNNWYSVCWSPELGLFVSVAQTGTGNRVMTSPDGTTWTSRTSAADSQWVSVCWSAELGLFVAVSVSGTGNRVMTSPNGTAWTIRTSASDNNWNSVCWSPELGLFVAVATGPTVASGRIMTSPDGITWTARTAAAENYWSSVCWSAELGIFVAVSSAAATKETSVMTSSDGINWTARTSPLLSTWNSLCWSAELSLFVAVSSFGTGNRVMTSPDGITWTTSTSAVDNDWTSVCWSPELGLFVAAASNGSVAGNRVMTSPDGITWTSRTSAADNAWYSVCWSPELQTFATVGASGTGNRVMTASYPLTVTATGDTQAIGNIKATGNIIAAATLTASDERLKANIKTINDAVNKVMALRGVSFERNGKEQIGVIAQEVQKVLPQVVDVPDNANDYLAVSYGNIVGLLIEAVKDQQNQIEDLKKLVEARS